MTNNKLLFLFATLIPFLLASPSLSYASHVHSPPAAGSSGATSGFGNTSPSGTTDASGNDGASGGKSGNNNSPQPTTLSPGGKNIVVNPGCITPIGGTPCGTPPKIVKTPDKKPLCPISTNNMSNTCIFIIHKTVVKHQNTVTPMPVVTVNGMQLQLLNCTIMNNNQVLCNFQGTNNGAVLH
jgi:hypothetical protein